MATRKPTAYCPICGQQLQFQVEHTDSRKPGPTKWVMVPHQCPPEAVQRFASQEDQE